MIYPYDIIDRLRSISSSLSKVEDDINRHEKAAQRRPSL